MNNLSVNNLVVNNNLSVNCQTIISNEIISSSSAVLNELTTNTFDSTNIISTNINTNSIYSNSNISTNSNILLLGSTQSGNIQFKYNNVIYNITPQLLKNIVDTSNLSIATQSYVNTAISNLVNSSPQTLDTLNELATALNNDPNFSTTITNLIGTKAPINNPSFTGTPISITPSTTDNSTKIATTEYVKNQGYITSTNIQTQLDLKLNISNPKSTGWAYIFPNTGQISYPVNPVNNFGCIGGNWTNGEGENDYINLHNISTSSLKSHTFWKIINNKNSRVEQLTIYNDNTLKDFGNLISSNLTFSGTLNSISTTQLSYLSDVTSSIQTLI